MLKKIASILLALFFLMSSSHLSFATHYCGGKVFKHALLISTSEFGCGMEKATKDCENKTKTQKNCCDNELVELSIKDNYQPSLTKINAEQHFIFVTVAAILFSVPITIQNKISFQDYHPPLPDKDIPILFQSFLI